jgi:NADP-dependent 3-hydroxy acid dehydrogenase YdfG
VADPVFLVTGASSGIGEATARRAAQAGYRLVLAARRVELLEKLVEELGGTDRALAVRCDVTEWADQEALAEAAISRFGQLDVAFANAGFGAKRGFLEETPEHWKSMVLTNVYGVALTIRATLPALKEARGHLLLTGSVAGRRALAGSLYSATKWAVTAMGEAARLELTAPECGSRSSSPARSTRPSSTSRRKARSRWTTSRAPCCSRSASRRTSTSTNC